MDKSNNTIDESLYSRQLYVLGHEAMKKMSESSILLIGLNGLGIEVAKNIVLAGIKSLTIFDNKKVELRDLGSQFYLTEEDLGKPIANCCVEKLKQLNLYVPIEVISELDLNDIDKFQTVICVSLDCSKQIEINNITHKKNIKFISCDVKGLFGSVFCDFGKDFTITDKDGNEPITGMIANITSEEKAIITCVDEKRHNLEDDMIVKLEEINGIEKLNNKEFKIKTKGPYSFEIDENTTKTEYKNGGIFTQVKKITKRDFKPLNESIDNPEIMISDFAKFERSNLLHKMFIHSDKISQNIEEFKKIVTKDIQEFKEIDELIDKFIQGNNAILPPMTAVIGGFVAQEVLKSVSGKFTPLHQHLYFDAIECIPTSIPTSSTTDNLKESRYLDQLQVFGHEFVDTLHKLNIFLVGSGAIGCELMKNFALMGISTKGKLNICDMDIIERSNLNRQFLFRTSDVGKFKCEVASQAAIKINGELEGRIKSYQDRVGQETENIYNDSFFENIDIVTNALDNVDARRYMDLRCVYFRKPLLESGTLGTKGNVQTVVPFLTESYSSSQDPPEKSIPICTLKNFPNQIDHTIQWARDMFEGLFKQPLENCRLYKELKNEYIKKIMDSDDNATETLNNLNEILNNIPSTFTDCLKWAREVFESNFNNNIKQLLFNFPPDSKTSSGLEFWSPPKRQPKPVEFDVKNELHFNFVLFAAKLRAQNFNINIQSENLEHTKELLNSIKTKKFVPKQGVKIQINENEPIKKERLTNKEEIKKIVDQLPDPSSLESLTFEPLEFEKDDDSNHHIDFITYTSNLRATNYGIKLVSKYETKKIAGKIIPAIATTTSLIVGLVTLELYKMVDYLHHIHKSGKIINNNEKEKWLDRFKNGFVNLALPLFAFSSPIKAQTFKYNENEFTLWDRFEIDDITLQEFIDYFKNTHKLEITMLSSGVSMLYSSFMQKTKVQERLPLKMSQLVEKVSKKKIKNTNAIIFEMCVTDENDEDVEVPYVKVILKK